MYLRAETVSPYDRDFALWVQAQVAALRSGKWTALDIENVTEELGALAKRDRRELMSRIRVLGVRLLKRCCQPENESSSWLGTIVEQSERIGGILRDSPSLRRELPEMIAQALEPARTSAISETGLTREVFDSQLDEAQFLREWCTAISPADAGELIRAVERLEKSS